MPEKKPNVFLIVLDATRVDHLSCYGYHRSTSPNIDKLAKEGVKYTSAISSAPWTLPSFASLFTGMYRSNHDVDRSNPFLNYKGPTIAELFRDNGYKTVCVSNNSWISEYTKFNRGFQNFLKVWQYFQINEDVLGERAVEKHNHRPIDVLKSLFRGNIIKNSFNTIYGLYFYKRRDFGAIKVNQLFKSWLNSMDSKKSPIFACLHFLEPHPPFKPPKEFAKKFISTKEDQKIASKINQDFFGYISGEKKINDEELRILADLYDAEINYFDYRVGELIRLLKKHDLYENSIIIIAADHGTNLGEHGLLDHQYCLYDTLIRIPLIIKFPYGEHKGINDDQIQNIDILPSLIDSVGFNRENATFDGVDVFPDSKTKREYTYSEYLEPQPSIQTLINRFGNVGVKKYDRSLRCIRTKKHKLIEFSSGEVELYDVEKDPAEMNNVYYGNDDIAKDYLSRLNDKFGPIETCTKSGFEIDKEIKKRLEDLGYF